MLDHVEVARILDILGNRNRRRIIELLRQKPCFVTEISDRLLLSPKAVIEHLQLMEREEILSFRLDERRRKYYYLANDISVMVSLRRIEEGLGISDDRNKRLKALRSRSLSLFEGRIQCHFHIKFRNLSVDITIWARAYLSRFRQQTQYP